MKRLLQASITAMLLVASSVSAQFLHIGNPDIQLTDLTSGGAPTTLTIDGLDDIRDYAFDGSTLEIPFTLTGESATVWLIIYTEGQSAPFTIEGEGPAPYADPEHATPGWHVYGGTDWLVYKSSGERFSEGDNVITWNGQDMDGNVVGEGSYQLFLAAFADEATPHVVGVAARQFGSGKTIYINTDRGEFVNFFDGEVNDMTNDWIGNLDGFDLVDNQAVVDACGDREGCPVGIISATPTGDGSWIGNSRGGGTGWLYKYSYDWDTRQITMDEDWAVDNGAIDGIMSTGEILPGRQYASSLSPDGSEIYATAGVAGTVSKVATWRADDGAFVPSKDWDLSDIFLYDNNGSDRSGGPGTIARHYDGSVDESGITMSGHHTSLTMRMDFDGNVVYMNRNGDGFGDSRVFAEGTFGEFAHGHTEAPAFKYSLYSTKWGWVTNIEAGTNNSQNGFMLGEDGSGLFHFEPKQIPLTWPQYNIVVDEDGPWDGVYMSVGGFGNEAAANEFVPEPAEEGGLRILAKYPIVQLPYDQKRVALGSDATAVLERSGETPDEFEVSEAYPNPFNPETSIRFDLPFASDVKVTVYNDQGQVIRTLADQTMGPGTFDVTWDGRDSHGRALSSGTYLYVIEAPGLRTSRKVTLLK